MDNPPQQGPLGPEFADLTETESEKLTQFKDLTGIEQLKCLQILRANDWNLEVALDLALDGAYNEDQTIYNRSQPSPPPLEEEPNSTNTLRHRHQAGSSSANSTPPLASTSRSNSPQIEPDSPPLPHPPGASLEEDDGLAVVLWNSVAWLLKLPFVIVLNTVNTFFDIVATLIRPTLNYDSTGTVSRYVREFEEKYGTVHPTFHQSSYNALLDLGKRDIRFIVIYLHTPSHRDTDSFCNNVIATQRFTDFINNENIIFWSCSVYYPEGYKVYQSLKASAAPFVALIGLKNNRMVAMRKLEGTFELDVCLAQLKLAMANNEYSLIAARVDREERNMAHLIRAQQDVAFEESLRQDQEKERKKREAEEKKAEEDRLVKEQEEAEGRRQDAVIQLKSTLKAALPEEPETNNSDALRIMFKLPNGSRLERRFLKNDPVKYLYFYVFASEESLFNFKLRTNFPTRDLPGQSPAPENDLHSGEMSTPLEQCGVSNNLVLFVHDLDS